MSLIQIRNITKKFPTVTALDSVSLGVEEGEFFGLLGPNGAGKSTLMNLLIGYLQPEGGEITIAGERVTQDALATRQNVGLVPQALALYDDLSGEANMEIFGGFYHIEKNILRAQIQEKLSSVGLFERRKDRVKTYSGGMKRRLNLVASLLHDPPILLCDEPTVGIDPQSRNAIFDYLEKLNHEGKTIIYTTHYMEEAERLCGRIAIIDNGKIIAEGGMNDLLQKLPHEEAISISKNAATAGALARLRSFGSILEEDDHYELTPSAGFRLSQFFAYLEESGISPRSVEIRRPTLEALFLQLTGRRLRD